MSDAKQSLWRQAGPAGVLGLLWGTMPLLGSIALFAKRNDIGDFLRSRGPVEGPLIFIGAFAVTAGLGLLPTYVQAIMGGWCLGFAIGFPSSIVALLGGSMIGYFVALAIDKHRVEHMIQANVKARTVRDAMIGHGFWKSLLLVTLVRLPSSPFALTNLAMESTGVPRAAYVAGTLLGMAPRTGVAVFVGAGIKQMTKESMELPKWAWIAGIVATLVAIGIVGAIAKKAFERATATGEAQKAMGQEA